MARHRWTSPKTKIFYATRFLEPIQSICSSGLLSKKLSEFHSECTYTLDDLSFKWHGVNKMSLVKITNHNTLIKISQKSSKVGPQ